MFINNPNLPTSKVKCVIVDHNAPQSLLDYLNKNNIEYIKSCYIKNSIEAVSTHPDMQICHLGSEKFVAEPTIYQYYKKQLDLYGVNVSKGKSSVACNYPQDISYNVVITNNFMLHNVKYTDKAILDYAGYTNISIYNVKQGYTKCATCVIDENAIITSDEGIYKICAQNSIDCLLIEKDIIKLGDRNDGFIGGCCGMIDYKTLLFCGDISAHKSYKAIMDFAEKYGVKILSSSKEMLTDVGSIIPVVQE
ncbi:MAG: hypothetical protein UH854_01835 [Clostridia bacterium]|nr:hypothetical protein [Clostridia bacterium]